MFKFRLEKVLSYKKQIEKSKQNEYSKVLRRLEDAKFKREALLLKKKHLLEEEKEVANSGKQIQKINEYNNYIKYIKSVIKKVDYNIETLEKEVEKRRLELERAVVERKILDKFEDKEKEKYRKEQLKIEAGVVNELVSYEYSIKKE